MIGVASKRPSEVYHHQAGPELNRIRGAIMPAHRKYFNLPESKTCPECGGSFSRPANYGHDRWFKAELCSLSCASTRGNRRRAEARAAEFASVFDGHVDRRPGQGPNGQCWEWQALRDTAGYGRISYGNKSRKAHRIALFGIADIGNPLNACHTCDNPPCCNPAHLFPGTIADNSQDMVAKGRHRGNHRLTEAQVREIRDDTRHYGEIARAYGVSPSSVGLIKRGQTWKAV